MARTCRCIKKSGGFARCRKGMKKVCYRVKKARRR